MKPQTYLLYFLLSINKVASGKIQAITENDNLDSCLLSYIRQNIDVEIPLIFVLTDDDRAPIPKQYEKNYMIIKIGTFEEMTYSSNTHFVIFAKSGRDLENAMNTLRIGKMWEEAPNYKILIVTTSSKIKPIIGRMWRRKVIYVAIVKYSEDVSIVYRSDPFDVANQCGKTPIAVLGDKCNETRLRFVTPKNLNGCFTGFITVFDYNDTDNVFPVTKRVATVMQNVFDIVTWGLIVLVFVIVSLTWWILTNDFTPKQLCLSVLEVWCLTLCGCIKKPPTLRYLRPIFVLYLFCVIVIHAVFKGNLIKSMTISDYNSKIKTIADVANSRLVLTAPKMIIDNFFEDDLPHHQLYSKIQNKLVPKYKGFEDAFAFKNCIHLTLRHVVEEFQASTNMRVHYFIDNSLTGNYKVWIGLQTGHFFTKSFQKHTSTVIESGVYSKIILDFTNEHYRSFDVKAKNQSNVVVLTVRHLYGTFVVWIIGIFASILIFIAEKIWCQ
ncbi:hypothetical protein FQR65_LT08024 [Abscondita terminalis]|nr:hypothetical protein FQR65_LT08024 [Abscondita terminalis]